MGTQSVRNTHPSDQTLVCDGRSLVRPVERKYEPQGRSDESCYTKLPQTILPSTYPDTGTVVRWGQAGTRTLRKVDDEFYMTDQNELISAVLYSRLKERSNE